VIAAILALMAMTFLPSPASAAAQPVVIKMADTPAVYEPAKVTVNIGQPVDGLTPARTSTR